VKQIHANLLTTQSRQQSYANKRHRPLEFEVDDHVYLRVSPMKGVRRIGIKGKLAPRYIGLYPILEKYGPLAYRVELPSKLSGVHNVFHVSQLKRCLKPPTNVGPRACLPTSFIATAPIRHASKPNPGTRDQAGHIWGARELGLVNIMYLHREMLNMICSSFSPYLSWALLFLLPQIFRKSK
jgi:hypothetical protein